MGFVIASVDTSQVGALLNVERRSQLHPWQFPTFVLEFSRDDAEFLVARGPTSTASAGAVQIVGYICGWAVTDEAQLHNIAVVPEAQRHGAGKALLQAFLERMRRRGCKRCILEVRMSNLPAIAFYRRMGFVVCGWRPDYYDHPNEDACMMVLDGKWTE